MLQQKPFILLVEDDRSLRNVLSRYLQQAGYAVLAAASFSEAIDKVAIKPNLVVLDINLPDGTGWEVAQWIEQLMEPVPVIVMSGAVRPSPKQLQNVGARAFLPKPFAIEELIKLVKQYAPAHGKLA